MSTQYEFVAELRKRFHIPPSYDGDTIITAWRALMADGSVEHMDDTPYSAYRIFYEHLAEASLPRPPSAHKKEDKP